MKNCDMIPYCPGNIKVGINTMNSRCVPSYIYKTVVLKPNFMCCKNVLCQHNISEENVKYVIKYDFDLLGDTIVVPKNCILEFDGGSLNNGTIVGQDTLVVNIGDVEIWGDKLEREGTWRESGFNGTDKTYDPVKFSGFGKVYLKKNIVVIDDVEKNILVQDAFYKDGPNGRIPNDNTIFVVMYDFDLNDEEIIVPENSVIEFDGGSVSNGKLVSNNTIILGNYRGDALYGVYLNSLKEPMSYNYKQLKTLTPSVEHGYTPYITDTNRKRVTQSIAVFKYNGRKYIATFHEESDEGGIYLFDEYYNFIKYLELYPGEIDHFNDVTVRGNDILCASLREGSPGIRKIRIEDLLYSTNLVYSTKLELCANKRIISIDYDNTRNELAVFTSDRSVEVYNDDDELVAKAEEVSSKIDPLLNSRISYQGMIYKNGQVIMLVYSTPLDGGEFYDGAVPVLVDINTGNVFVLPYQQPPFADMETEAVCKDPDDDSIYWNVVHMWAEGYGSTSRSAIVKNSFDTEFVFTANYRNQGEGSLAEGTYVYLYISATGTEEFGTNYVPDGTLRYPYKTLDSAIICGSTIAGRVQYRMAPGDYYAGDYVIANKFVNLLRWPGKSGTVTVHGRWRVWGGYAYFNNVTLVNDWDNSYIVRSSDNAHLIIDNVVFTSAEKRNCAISLGNTTAEITNASFDKFTYAIITSGSIIQSFSGITIHDCDFVLSCNGESEVLQGSLFNNITFSNITGTDHRRLIKTTQNDTGTPVIKFTLDEANAIDILNFLDNRVNSFWDGSNHFYIAGAIEVFIRKTITLVAKRVNDEIIFSEDKQTLDTGEFKVEISRGYYYYNGEELVSYNGRNSILSRNNPNYTDLYGLIPKGEMFFNSYNRPVIHAGANLYLRFLCGQPEYIDPIDIDNCYDPGLYCFEAYGDNLPDLGSTLVTSSPWYYVLNVGNQVSICQTVLHSFGTKIGIRYRESGGSWSDWTIFEGAEDSEEDPSA